MNDSMSPEEQANYENVRTMNAGATDYARQLLARTMARPQRDYFAALPPTSQLLQPMGGNDGRDDPTDDADGEARAP